MRRAFHYTAIESYEKIKQEGQLIARSPLIHLGWSSPALEIEIPDDKFIFAFLDTPEPEGWKISGYLDVLLNIYFRGKQTALLSFPLNGEKSFVLEARPTFDMYNGKMNAPEAFRKYVESMVDVKRYSGQYEMPELIVAGNIPMEKINLENRL